MQYRTHSFFAPIGRQTYLGAHCPLRFGLQIEPWVPVPEPSQSVNMLIGGATSTRASHDVPATGQPVLVMGSQFALQSGLGRHLVWLVTAGVIYIAIMSFLVSAVCGYMAGLIGSSNSPLSGIGILAVIGIALMVIFGLGIGLYFTPAQRMHRVDNTAAIAAPTGSAVDDLQTLDKNHDLYADFELLDDLDLQQDVTANP